MIRTSLSLLFTLLAVVAWAHPGIGIVEDSKGNVFFTDLVHVWKISPDGKKSIAVERVHTHELFIDEHDNLFGEHLWYNGEATNTWGHYVWKVTSEGKLSKVIPDKDGFLEDYSFVRDHAGRMYWADRTTKCQHVTRRNEDGTKFLLGDRCFSNIRWMAAGQGDEVLLVDNEELKRLDTRGHVTTLAVDLPSKKLMQFNYSEGHSLGGISQDSDGNIYIADLSGRAVKKIAKDGTVSIVAETNFPWTPTGVLVGSNNDLWLLETTITNDVRVERVTNAGIRFIY